MKKLLFMLFITLSVFLELAFANQLKPTILKIDEAKNVKNKIEVFTKCDEVISDEFQRRCISNKAMKPRFSFYFLTKNIINGSIKKRMRFKDDRRLKVQNYEKCYIRSGFDRGHLAPDASFDYNKSLLITTYYTSNIVPETPVTNRRLITKVEREFRNLINKYKQAYIITGGHFIFKDEYKFNPKNRYHLNCGYFPNYIYKIIYIPSKNLYIGYTITNVKPYRLKRLDKIGISKILKINNIKIIKNEIIIYKPIQFKYKKDISVTVENKDYINRINFPNPLELFNKK